MHFVRSTCILALVLCQSAPVLLGQNMWKFAFGTPDSVTRAGFTKVTVKDAYPGDKGYGFESIQGLLAFDRGGSEIALPKDEYTARTYGAYRTSSDATCALIEGTTNNAFQVTVPNGDYAVWLVACDAEWDPPLFEVWANGRKKLDVRIPRARFVFSESFQARADEGRLRLEFKGPHGWIINSLVIGKPGPELAGVTQKLERDIFFLTEPELPNWKESRPLSGAQLELSTTEQQKGYVVFPVDYTEQITPGFVPSRASIGKPLITFATPDEFEPAAFCISAHADLGNVAVELNDFAPEKGKHTVSSGNVTVGIVQCLPRRESSWGTKGAYRVVPEMIMPRDGRASRVESGQIKQWWLTVHVPQDTPAGRYRMSLTVRPEKAPPSILEWRLLVLPFQLTRPVDKHWGTWLESFPPVGGLRGPSRRGRNTPAEEARLVRADLTDYRDHGFDLAIFNYYFGVKENPDGTFTYDLSALARDLEYWKTLGANTPVAIGCEYTFRNLEYALAEPGQKHVPGTFSPKAHQAIVGLVRQIRDEAKRQGWPKLYFFPIDEPGNNKTENRMRFAENVLNFVHEVPGCQTATTVGASDVQRLGERVDARIYAYGNYNRKKVLQDTQRGHPFWYYENGMFYGRSTLDSRSMTGFEFLRSGAEVATAWGFDCTQDNPYNDFDGGHKDWNVVFPGADHLMPTIYWELCREGVDDYRYVATLQEHIRHATEQGRTKAAQRAQAVLDPLLDPDAPHVENALTFSRFRWRIAREILSFHSNHELALSFPAVVNNRSDLAQVGTNVIADASFEAGPQADGFPVLSYDVGDRFSKPDQKPVDALSVTDQVAHSGRYSLKWDFSKAIGKGSVYDGRHYLIVNVRVPQNAARLLRGKRVRVAYWLRLESGSALPGLTLREFGKNEFLDGLSYNGGVEDPSVWNHFEAQGRLRSDFDNLDIHISCAVPDDPEVARKSLFFIDDVSLQIVEEPPMLISTPLDEYYIGEKVHWKLATAPGSGPVKVQLRTGTRVLSLQTDKLETGMLQGDLDTSRLKPGVYCLCATSEAKETPRISQCQFILAPDPFNWPDKRQ